MPSPMYNVSSSHKNTFQMALKNPLIYWMHFIFFLKPKKKIRPFLFFFLLAEHHGYADSCKIKVKMSCIKYIYNSDVRYKKCFTVFLQKQIKTYSAFQSLVIFFFICHPYILSSNPIFFQKAPLSVSIRCI